MKLFTAILVVSLALVDSFNLECEFMPINWRFVSGTGCNVTHVHIKANSNAVSSVNELYAPNEDTTILIIRKQKVLKVPNDINVFFPKLEGLELHETQLKTLEQADLKPLPHLKELWLANNQLETLKSDLFEFNPEIELVVFSKNKLKFIGDGVLGPLTKLVKANFNDNYCIDEYAGTRWQREELKRKLKKNCERPRKDLNVAEGEIAELKEKLVSVESKLKTSHGNLVAATKHLLEETKKSEVKKFVPGDTNNPVTALICKNDDSKRCEADELVVTLPHTEIHLKQRDADSAVLIGHVTSLIIAEQQVLYLPSNLANYFPNLTTLVVTFTGVFSIERHAYESLTNLVHLSLNQSVIHEVPSDTFLYLENLRELDLSFNQITQVEHRAFNGLASLEELKLNDNLIEKIDGNIFESLKNLLGLSMQNNRLKTIEAGLFSPLSKLLAADFTGSGCINASFPLEPLQAIATKMRADCQ